jgi:hypothetical protein
MSTNSHMNRVSRRPELKMSKVTTNDLCVFQISSHSWMLEKQRQIFGINSCFL